MRPETLPLISDYKKEYKFLWLIEINETHDSQVMDRVGIDGMKFFNNVVSDIRYSSYISQLAETVNPPDDEFEIETIPQGPVDYQMPKKVKLDDISVTYLEDTLESVYNFHKAWYQAIRCGKTVGINSPYLFSASARYIPFDDTMLATEYIAFKNQFVQNFNSAVSSNRLMPSLPLGAKATSIITYPRIYPKKIHRSAANHGGESVATVDVTYARIPEFKKKNTALQMWDGYTWHNTSNGKMV